MPGLDLFSAPNRAWFTSSCEGPTPAQERGWEAISQGAYGALAPVLAAAGFVPSPRGLVRYG